MKKLIYDALVRNDAGISEQAMANAIFDNLGMMSKTDRENFSWTLQRISKALKEAAESKEFIHEP